MIRSFFFIVFILISSFSWAQSSTDRGLPSLLSGFEEDWMINLHLGRTGAQINHTQEISSQAGFLALPGVSEVSNTLISLSVTKEFMAQNRLSFSTSFLAGIVDGSEEAEVQQIVYLGESQGVQFGAQFSVNLNYSAYKMKLQPFVGLGLIQEATTYNIAYLTSETEHNYSATLADLSLGIRFLDPSVGLMSFFQLGYVTPMSESLESSANVAGLTGSLSNTEFQIDNIRLTLGFGAIF